MNALFLESSAVLAIILHEAKRDEALSRINAAGKRMASRLLKIECERALIRYSLDRPDMAARLPEMRHELARLWPKVNFVEMTRSICDSAGRICPNSRLRTLDAIHLATYFQAKEASPEIEMLSYDACIRDELKSH